MYPRRDKPVLRYTKRGLSARVKFYSPYNGIAIIVEDVGLENFYTVLFNRLLGDEPKIGRVLGVGGKEQVLERYRRLNNTGEGNYEFYLVDGDFDELIGQTLPYDDRFYQLNNYDIENYLVESTAIVNVAEEQNPKHSAAYYKRRLDAETWKVQLAARVERLIACFAVLHKLRLVPESRAHIERFMSGHDDLPDSTKITAFIDESSNAQQKVCAIEFDELLNCMEIKMRGDGSEKLRWVSGKNILLPLVVRQLRNHTGTNITLISLRFRLMKHCQFPGLADLKQRVQGIWVKENPVVR